MATPQDVATVREYVNEPTTETYSDERLSELIDALEGDLRKVAARIWSTKAARYAELADVQEGSSRRELSQLYKQALAMHGHWSTAEDGEIITTMRPGRTRAIERP